MAEPIEIVKRAGAPLVTVCIAHYMGVDLLATCLDSVMSQVRNFEVEIIVHDDASDPDSLDFLRSHYPQVKVIASDTNVGFCIANNRMIEHARGQYVLLLNNDAALHPDALTTLAEAASQFPDAILTLPQFDWESGDLVDRGCLLDLSFNPIPNIDPDRISVAMAIGACLWIPRKQWQRLGGFPEWFESIAEDLFLCCAARLVGLEVRVVAGSGYRHRQGASFGGNKPDRGNRLNSTFRRRYLSERNKAYTLLILIPTAAVLPIAIVHFVTLLVEGVLLSVARRDGRILSSIYLAALGSVLKNWRICFRFRQAIQKKRRVRLMDFLAHHTLIPRKLTLLYLHGWPRINR